MSDSHAGRVRTPFRILAYIVGPVCLLAGGLGSGRQSIRVGDGRLVSIQGEPRDDVDGDARRPLWNHVPSSCHQWLGSERPARSIGARASHLTALEVGGAYFLERFIYCVTPQRKRHS